MYHATQQSLCTMCCSQENISELCPIRIYGISAKIKVAVFKHINVLVLSQD